ncbi:hypothetical protein ANCDUO_23062 [Ancylostoma duodenale]|uniref:Uncharacterized protein n=1 Tax=Ancylostoma duodenale TaxID=51022 RepID=A0A0C2CAP4_9BILA|nr:hypothetical protein ANCDUO_23062 [Ancylostoma duodenale]
MKVVVVGSEWCTTRVEIDGSGLMVQGRITQIGKGENQHLDEHIVVDDADNDELKHLFNNSDIYELIHLDIN